MSLLQRIFTQVTRGNLRTQLPQVTCNPNRFTSTSEVVSEKDIKDMLQTRFKGAEEIHVEDVSGGCGAMFNVYVATSEFKGLSIVKQHKAITETLKDQIKKIHGLRIETKAT